MDPYTVVGPCLRLLAPETAHRLTLAALAAGLAPVVARRHAADPRLGLECLGLRFASPIGLAAGFDKNAEAPAALLRLGFGFVEIGSVTPRPQPGNPRPRVFRLARQQALINRLGFNNDGLDRVVARLSRLECSRVGPIGANIGRNRDSADPVADYVAGIEALGPLVDYLAINVSSPNTPGLRQMQSPAALETLLSAAALARGRLARRVPLLLKIAPDLGDEDIDGIVQAALDHELDGLIVANTTVARPADLPADRAGEAGGLSGRPLMAPSTEILRRVARRTQGRLTLIGVGGVAGGADAYAKIRAGASLVQLYTALVYQGPGLVARIARELAALLDRDGFASPAEAVGADLWPWRDRRQT